MRFLVDAQLPPALARWLASRGHEAEHVFDCGLTEAGDRTIWRRAATAGAAIVTKDEDFALIRTLETDGPAVVWIRLGNTRRQQLLRWFERPTIMCQSLPQLLSGQVRRSLSELVRPRPQQESKALLRARLSRVGMNWNLQSGLSQARLDPR